MENKSGLRPLGHAVLVKPYEPELSAGVIILPPEARGKMTVAESRVTVIEVGSEAWVDERVMRAVPGDKVLIAKFSGAMAVGTLDGKEYRLVNARDIYCLIETEKEKSHDRTDS